MTVKELIQLLQEQPPNMSVVTDLHSEYSEVKTVKRISGYDNGGYVSAAYRAVDRLKVHGYVYVGVSET